MPIEIKELIVRTTVDTDQGKREKNEASSVDVSQIVAECVEQVLDILKQHNER
ncbi:MAG: DUF5908 family protein [Bacteroidota bacterium]